MEAPLRSPVQLVSPTPRRFVFLAEALTIAFLFWADIYHWHHVILLSKTPYLLVLGWASLHFRNQNWRSVGMVRPDNWHRTILFGLTLGCAMEAIELFITQPTLVRLFQRPPDFSALQELHNHLGMLAVALGLTWSLAAFGEELVWRGYILNRIAEVLGPGRTRLSIAVILSSALFGFAHYDQGITGITENVIDGALLTFIYLASGRNLWLPILAHGVTDTVDCLLLYSGHYPMY